MDAADVGEIAAQLRAAARELRARGLKQAARFASELLLGVPDETRARLASSSNPPEPRESRDARLAAERDRFEAARASFDVGEYLRAHHLLSSGMLATRAPAMHETRFLRYYALFLAGEKAKEERDLELNVTGARAEVDRNLLRRGANPRLKELYLALGSDFRRDALDAFGLYLFAVVLRRLGYATAAGGASAATPAVVTQASGGDSRASALPLDAPTRSVLVESIRRYPWNWSAWMELAALSPFTSSEEDAALAASSPWMFELFQAHALLDQQQNDAARELLARLERAFPQSTHLLAQQALTSYHMRDLDQSQDEFERLASADPHRLEHMDVYSNVLYVKEDRTELSRLAHRALQVEKYRPETCCIVGNYYSLKGKHDRAIVYFRRALRLDPNFLSAWTLIGHEYVEMKNTGAAVEAYRHAVDLNERDYRAWYGLGQAYEILNMFLYSVYYYRKAAAIRPFDPRMWTALGGCYDQLGKVEEAVASFRRAVANQDREGTASYHLGRIFERRGELHEAAKYFQIHLGLRPARDGGGGGGGSGSDSDDSAVVLPRDGASLRVDSPGALAACLFLANYYKQLGRFAEATVFCNRLLDLQGPEHEEAKALLREMRSLEAARAHGGGAPSLDAMDAAGG